MQSFKTAVQLRRRRNFLLAAFCAVLLPAAASAQQYPNGLSADSVNPAADSLAIAEFRAYLDSVRTTQRRPTVALVLSGGGAKGAAEVGVLKYLEEIGMPVDMICGTSIGGLIGGLYSIGYRADDIHELFVTQDWGTTLTDRIQPRFVSFADKAYRQKYQISIPFHYVRENLRLDVDDNALGTRAGMDRITSSLPSGYSYGFNVCNLLASLSVGYHDSLSFRSLPLPFMCVATDLVSNKARYWTSGSLKTAMRSTMSIPGLFDPVRTDGQALVDGGMTNNYATDFARAAGADYVLGVELSGVSPIYTHLDIGGMLSQSIKMLGNEAFLKNVEKADVKVKPSLEEFGMLSFTPEAVDTIFNRGYAAALEQREHLLKVREAVGASCEPVRSGAVNIALTPVQIGKIEFVGLSERESNMLMARTGLKAGQMVDKQTMDTAMSRIHATGAFDSVTYSLLGTESPYSLIFHCVKGPLHKLGLGFRLDTEEWAVMSLHLGLGANNLSGSRLEVDGRLGRTQSVSAGYLLDIPDWLTFNVKARLDNVSTNLVDSSRPKYALEFLMHQESAGLSYSKLSCFNFGAGLRYKYFRLSEDTIYGSLVSASDPDAVRAGYLGVFADAAFCCLDDKYFPSHGVDVTLKYDSDFRRNTATIDPLRSVGADLRFVIPLGRVFAVIPDLHWRSVFGNDDLMSASHLNYIGGAVPGRFLDQQIPFCGFGDIMDMKNHVAVANVQARVNAAKNLYVTLTGGYAVGGYDFDDMFGDDRSSVLGAALGVSLDSIVGPLRFDLRWSDAFGPGVYFSVGFDL